MRVTAGAVRCLIASNDSVTALAATGSDGVVRLLCKTRTASQLHAKYIFSLMYFVVVVYILNWFSAVQHNCMPEIEIGVVVRNVH